MHTLVVEVMEKRLEKEINEVLKHMDLHVAQVEFAFLEKLALTIKLKSSNEKETEVVNQVV